MTKKTRCTLKLNESLIFKGEIIGKYSYIYVFKADKESPYLHSGNGLLKKATMFPDTETPAGEYYWYADESQLVIEEFTERTKVKFRDRTGYIIGKNKYGMYIFKAKTENTKLFTTTGQYIGSTCTCCEYFSGKPIKWNGKDQYAHVDFEDVEIITE